MAANIVARYVWLIDIIRRYGHITYKEINRLWMKSGLNDGSELSLRMFHRHRAQIEEIFDIIIDCEKTPPYRYFISNYERLEADQVRLWMIDTYAVDNLLHNNFKLRSRVMYEPVPVNGKRFLTSILDAMEVNLKITIEYHTDYSPIPHTVTIEPYGLKMYRQRWYTVGRSDDKMKIYALDRITDCIQTDCFFELADDFSIDNYFADCFGIIKEHSVEKQTIRLRFSDEQAPYIRSLPIHPSQKEVDTNIFEVELCPTFDFIQFLFSQLNSFEILAPQSLREQVSYIADKISKNNRLV